MCKLIFVRDIMLFYTLKPYLHEHMKLLYLGRAMITASKCSLFQLTIQYMYMYDIYYYNNICMVAAASWSTFGSKDNQEQLHGQHKTGSH